MLKWINYWLVNPNATPKQRLNRIFEIGMSIGMIIGSIFVLGYIFVYGGM
jgi:hypothetical protein